jgi:hypothetical protein
VILIATAFECQVEGWPSAVTFGLDDSICSTLESVESFIFHKQCYADSENIREAGAFSCTCLAECSMQVAGVAQRCCEF